MSEGPLRGPGEAMIRRMVGLLQRVFYKETVGVSAVQQRPFYQDLRMLRMAVTWPARFIRDNGTGEFDAGRYEAIFGEIVKKVALNGTPVGELRHRGRYILKCVQDHWQHNWEEYAPASKSAGNLVAAQMRALAPKGEALAVREMEVLAATYDALKTGRPKKAAKAEPAAKGRAEIQQELF